MASTYVNNLRLEEIGTGEQSGTWGDTTNTNLEIIGQAVAWGTRAIANASTDNITIADGALDADRCLGLKLTGGGQACTVTLLPNTSSKTWFMYNATAAALTFTCGSGANVIIPAGQTKVIATDGLGSGGVVHDLLTAVNLAGTTQTAAVTTQGTLTVGVDDTGYDVKFFGATASAYMLWDESADDLILGGAAGLSVNSAALVTGVLTTTATAIFNGGFTSNGNSTVDGTLSTATGLVHLGDTNTSIDFGTDTQSFYTGGVRSLDFNTSETVFNEDHANLDFRIEGDTRANLFHVDAGDDSIGINAEGTGAALVTVQGRAGSSGSEITTKGVHIIEGGYNNGNTFQVSDASSVARFAVNGYGSSSVGGDATLAQWFNADGTYGTKFQVQTFSDDTDENYVTAAFIRSKSDTAPSYVVIGKNRGGAANSDTTLNGNDSIGAISFQGADGTTYQEAGRIASVAEAGWGANDGEARLEFYTNAGTTSVARRMSIHSGGNVSLEDGNLVIGTGGKGIDFSAQTASSVSGASTTAELLDHYEEGTFTIVGSLQGGTVTFNSAYNTMGYTRIGRKVTVTGLIITSAVSNPSGVRVQIGPLPFTTSNLTGGGGAAGGGVSYYDGSNIISKSWLTGEASTTFAIYVPCADLTAGDDFYVSATYFTND